MGKYLRVLKGIRAVFPVCFLEGEVWYVSISLYAHFCFHIRVVSASVLEFVSVDADLESHLSY